MIDELAEARATLGWVADAAAWALPEPELVAALDAVDALERQLASVKLALVRELDGRGTAVAAGASSTAVWLRERLRLSIVAARRLVTDAAAVDAACPVLRAALAAGTVNAEQTRVIADVVAAIPAEAGPGSAEKATELMIGWAGEFEPALLRKLGSRILDHVAPELADVTARAALEAADARAARDRHLTLADLHDGRLRLTGVLDAETGALLTAALGPLSPPAGRHDDRTAGQRRHDALGDLCRLALRTGELPEHGGDPAQLVVTVRYDALSRGLDAGALDTGLTLSAAAVRRLACDAAVLPAVLGGDGQVLDVGRQRRLIGGPLRRALVLRDRGCAFPGCDRPPRWCDGHHVVHWADGGATALANAVLLCRHHHRVVHHGDWRVRMAADGRPEFLPPAWLDPARVPRRNPYHLRI